MQFKLHTEMVSHKYVHVDVPQEMTAKEHFVIEHILLSTVCQHLKCRAMALMHESFVSTAPPPMGMGRDSDPTLFSALI